MGINRDTAKKRVVDLFRYVKELKSRIDIQILNENDSEWLFPISSLIDHPNIQIFESEDIVLRIIRPEETLCPPPPRELEEWIKPSWRKISNNIEVLESKNIKLENGEIRTVFFKDFFKLQDLLKRWSILRDNWKFAELPSEKVRNIFANLHELKAKIDKDSEKNQLYLTDGVLSISDRSKKILYPIIFKEVSLEFDGSKNNPEFIISKNDSASFLHLSLLRYLGVSGAILAQKKNEFEELAIDPDNQSKLSEFLRGIVHTVWQNGKFSESKIESIDETPIVYSELKLILGKKEDRFIEQIDNYISKIQSIVDFPKAFENIVGYFDDDYWPNIPPIPETDSTISFKSSTPEEFYLTKEYNIDQKKIISTLNAKGCVSVQGPPGTGKSHTIANLIGHLLAKGNSVLVSSYSIKALNVIREKVVEQIRSLCVSVLDNNSESKKQLQESVNFIDELLTKSDDNELSLQINELTSRKKLIESEIFELKERFRNMVLNEYRPISYQGAPVLPKEASIFIQKNQCSLITDGPFKSDFSPINNKEFFELTKTLLSIKPEEQKIIMISLPDIKQLPTVDNFEFLIKKEKEIYEEKYKYEQRIIDKLIQYSLEDLEFCADRIKNFCTKVEYEKETIWKQKIIEIVILGDQYKKIIQSDISHCTDLLFSIEKFKLLVFKYTPELHFDQVDIDSLIKAATKIANTNSTKTKFSLFERIFSKEIKILNEYARVSKRKPRNAEEYQSIADYLNIKKLRSELFQFWNDSFVQRMSFPSIDGDCENKEVQIKHFIKNINELLDTETILDDIKKQLSYLNIQWPTPAHDKIRLTVKDNCPLLETVTIEFSTLILPLIEYVIKIKKLEKFRNDVDVGCTYLKKFEERSILARIIHKDLVSKNYIDYKNNLQQLFILYEKKKMFESILLTINKLKQTAPSFANRILKRELDDDLQNNTNIDLIWKTSFLNWVISDRNKDSSVFLQVQISEREQILKTINAELIKKLVIRNQIRRTKNEHRQALRGWVQAQNKITKSGKGILDDMIKRESRKSLKKCKEAVPVWIMPLTKIMDNFTIGEDIFDVLIIDEASQADLTYLPIFSMAKKIIVVGDDKQVSPATAGKKFEGLENLIDEFLGEIPNKQNYDYRYSLYDIACASFGDPIRLSEHFRCTPEIIQFCNDLSYNGSIKVLRESKSNPIQPSLIPYYVEGKSEDDVNTEEAYMIVSMIQAMIENSEYDAMSIGVISLKGQRQHLLIDRILRKRLSAKAYESHKILCGKAPQFQGDERDIVFISLVDSPKNDGPLHLVSDTEERKKEYNVAVSRAKNQLIVVHSMDMDTHLKPGDMRLRLLKHMHDPRSILEKYSESIGKAESPFEKSVHEDLSRAEYDYLPQYEVGAYRIDIVLNSNDGRIAIECDGDKYHSTEEQIRNDLERQSILERLGFKFIRIKGSDYYRRKESTMKEVFDRLQMLGAYKKKLISQESIQSTNNETISRIMARAKIIRSEMDLEGIDDIEINSDV